MSNVRELLARLNPKVVRYNVGLGGLPELTNEDILGALSDVPKGLGRELLEACWWPSGGALHGRRLRDAVIAIVMPELSRQSRRLTEASLDLQLSEAAISWGKRAATSEQLRGLDVSRKRLVEARESCWPRNVVEQLPALTQVIVAEMSGAHLCESCQGTGTSLREGKSALCDVCKGTGLEPSPDLRRAKALKIDSRNFVRHWKPVYQWLLVRFRDAEQDAARRLTELLRRDMTA